MKVKYKPLKESNVNLNYQYERNIILNKYKTKQIQLRAKIMQLIAKSRELTIQMQEELSDLQREFQSSISQNLKHSTIPTTSTLLKR